jgi:hypothetical protein
MVSKILFASAPYPPIKESYLGIKDSHIPQFMVADIERAYKIYGEHPEYVQGQMTKNEVCQVPVDLDLRSVEKNLKLYKDIMFFESEVILVTVADPLNIILQCRLENKSRQELGNGLQGHLATLCAKGFNPTVVYMDPHSTFRQSHLIFQVLKLMSVVWVVNAKIHQIKEMYW